MIRGRPAEKLGDLLGPPAPATVLPRLGKSIVVGVVRDVSRYRSSSTSEDLPVPDMPVIKTRMPRAFQFI
jgi:hypothetical protein